MSKNQASPIPERYEVLENLVQDEVEVLYRCRDTTLGREVLCKLPGIALAEHSGTDDKRALREGRSLAQVMHPGIQRLLDVVEIPGGPLLVMEPVPGEILAERLERDERMTPEEVCQLGIELADALSAVHAIGAVHRDLAPQHVVIRPDGTACLIGFQLVKFTSDSGEMSSIAYVAQAPAPADEGRRKLLPTYPAPEQFGGEVANPRTDIFGLGSLLYRCLTGVDAIPGLLDRGWQPPKDPARVVPGVSKALGKAIVSCLARSPVGRTQSAAALRDALEAVRGPKVAAGAGGQKSRAPWIGIAAAALIVVGAGWKFGPVFGGTRGTIPGGGEPAETYTGLRGELAASYSSRHALLIGIGEAYKDSGGYSALKAPVGDVEAIGDRLRSLPGDWEITLLLDEEATGDRIIRELQALEDRTQLNDQVLIFYAGHGVPHDKAGESGWIVPADGVYEDRPTFVHFDAFTRFFDHSEAKHIMLAMDCCHSGRVAQVTRGSASRSYKERFLRQKAHIILTSGRGNEEVLDELEDGHSPLASALLNELSRKTEAITSSFLYANVQQWFFDRGVQHNPVLTHLNSSQPGEFVLFLNPE